MFTDNYNIVVAYGIELALLLGKPLGKGYALDLEARLSKPIVIVTAVDATVIILAKEACAFHRVDDCVILEGSSSATILGHNHYAPTSRAHNAVELAHSTPIIGDMLEEVVADDDIYTTILHGYILHVEVHIGQWRIQIGRYIAIGATI